MQSIQKTKDQSGENKGHLQGSMVYYGVKSLDHQFNITPKSKFKPKHTIMSLKTGTVTNTKLNVVPITGIRIRIIKFRLEIFILQLIPEQTFFNSNMRFK